MKKISILLLLAVSMFAFTSCSENESTEDINYIGFESATFDFGVTQDGETSLDVKAFTTQTSSSDRTFTVNIVEASSTADPASYTVPASITVPANTNVGMMNITIADLNIGDAGETLVLEFAPVSGLYTGEQIVLNIARICPFNDLTLDITFDPWPEEVTWELLDGSGATVATGGPYAGASGDFSQSFCLADGTYTFNIYDAYGDGGGPVSLSSNGTSIYASSGGYGAGDSVTFDLGN